MSATRSFTAALAVAAVIAGAIAARPAKAPQWAPAASATIHPGVQTVTDGGQCTANFVFTDESGAVYLGQAAHCSGTGEQTDTNGCSTGSLPLGTLVTIRGAQHAGVLAYNSWLTMAALGEADAEACDFNDFALVRVDARDVVHVNPSVPSFGGPVGLAATVAANSRVSSYGNSGLRFGLAATSPKYGVSLGQSRGGWNHTVYTATPGIPGDSGSGFLDASGKAFGVLSTVQIFPLALSNGVSDLSRALSYANAHTSRTFSLALGTEPYDGSVGVTGSR